MLPRGKRPVPLPRTPPPADAPVRNCLRAVRVRLGLSQAELARAAGVTRQTISGIEAGHYSASAVVALRLARALACSVEELFWLEDERGRIEARPALEGDRPAVGDPVSVARVNGTWVARRLRGATALRTELLPGDAVVEQAPAGAPLTLSLLDDQAALERTVVLAGCAPALSLWARAAERWHPGLRVRWEFANSTRARQCLLDREVHVAGMHLPGTGGEPDNVAALRDVADVGEVVLICLGTWEEGLAVAPGNPRAIHSVRDLARPGVRLANREAGSGSRGVLDQELARENIAVELVGGYDRALPGHWEVAAAVLAGEADAGITTAAVSRAFGLGFVPLRAVRYDLAVPRSYLELEPVRQLLATLDHHWVRRQLATVGGYDTSRTGEVVAELPESSTGAATT